MLTNNRIWRNRTVDIGVVTAEDALNYGFRWGSRLVTLRVRDASPMSRLQQQGHLLCPVLSLCPLLGLWGRGACPLLVAVTLVPGVLSSAG